MPPWQSREAADDAPIEIERELSELGADVAATTEAARAEDPACGECDIATVTG